MSTTRGAPAVQSSGAAPDPGPDAPRKRPVSPWRNRFYNFDVRQMPYLLISPFFILFAVFGLFPLIFNGIVSFRTWRLIDQDKNGWAGFGNYTRLLHDEDFWNALYNTFGIFILSTVPQLLLALVVASVLNRKLRAQTWWRVGVLIPYVTPLTASTLVFGVVFARDYGVANWVLDFLHIHSLNHAIDWRSSKLTSWVALATMVNWKWTGYNALLYLSAMQSIPKDVYEAAAIDGASPWKQLWKITVPMIRPVVIFTVVLSTIGGLQLFTEPVLFEQNVQAMTGGANGEWQTVAQLIFKVAWKNFNLGYAAAMSWALFLIIVLFAGINALITNRLGGGSNK